MKTCLFVIDPQVDFCDMVNGALPVSGADKDMERLAKMIDRFGGDIDDIQITMDSHYHLHIAHACVWVDQNGNHPMPIFLNSGNSVPTPITLDDIKNGKWRAYNPKWQTRFVEYVITLDKNGRYQLMIWPDHCIIGFPGQNLAVGFREAIGNWEDKFFGVAQRVTKGSNIFTEHYSAVKADVPDDDDIKTRLNTKLIDTLKKYDKILICGEALSHCVANTIRDVADEFDEEQVKKFVLLEDASSNVAGCEKMGEDFVNEMVGKGMELSKTDKFF